MHVQGLEYREDRIAEFKKTKEKLQTVREEMKDFFTMLFEEGWTEDLDEGKEGEAKVVHQ